MTYKSIVGLFLSNLAVEITALPLSVVEPPAQVRLKAAGLQTSFFTIQFNTIQ